MITAIYVATLIVDINDDCDPCLSLISTPLAANSSLRSLAQAPAPTVGASFLDCCFFLMESVWV